MASIHKRKQIFFLSPLVNANQAFNTIGTICKGKLQRS